MSNNRDRLINMSAAIGEITFIVPISYPLDVLKSRMQMGYYNNYKHFFTLLKTWEHNKTLYRGFTFLYTGLVIRQPMKMVAFESTTNPFYGGIYASVAGLIIGVPLSFVKTNYQTNNKFKLDYELLKKINLFRAWHYEICKESIGNMAFFSLYGSLRKYNDYFGFEYVDKMNFVNGTIASMAATFLAYPIDLMKVRKQTIHSKDSFKEIFKQVGYENNVFHVQNFWKGITPIFIRVSLFGGFGMFFYEKIRTQLAKII